MTMMRTALAALSLLAVTALTANAAVWDIQASYFDPASGPRDAFRNLNVTYNVGGDAAEFSGSTRAGVYNWRTRTNSTSNNENDGINANGDFGPNTTTGSGNNKTRTLRNASDTGNWLGNNQEFWSFCIQLTESTASNVKFDLIDPKIAPNPSNGLPPTMGHTKANHLRYLYAQNLKVSGAAIDPDFANSFYDNLYIATYGGTGDVISEAEAAAAFQLAIWEVSHESTTTIAGYNVNRNNGVFFANLGSGSESSRNTTTASDKSVRLANLMLARISLGFTGVNGFDLWAMGSPEEDNPGAGKQDQIIFRPYSGDEVTDDSFVPVPPTLALMVAGVVPGLGVVGLRRVRKAKAAA